MAAASLMPKRRSQDSGISALAPFVAGREHKQHRASLAQGVLKHVILAATTQRNPADLLLEIYMAGLWHGAEIGRKNGAIYGSEEPPPRERDVIRV